MADRNVCPTGENGTAPFAAKPILPASTGIGMEGRGVTVAALAVATERDDILAVPLENPRQVAACDYEAVYSPKPPRFSRAMALCCGPQAIHFISGTASITRSESRHQDDAAQQTAETLNNIEALIGEANLSRHGLPGFGTSLDGLASARVYVKRRADYPRIASVCRERLGELPIVYVLADVCRPELLVEIEAVAAARRSAVRRPRMLSAPPLARIDRQESRLLCE
jgi:enamine deaminase RidA (YjgF/YER057c/UK114 family)